jgi:hypothetical protein
MDAAPKPAPRPPAPKGPPPLPAWKRAVLWSVFAGLLVTPAVLSRAGGPVAVVDGAGGADPVATYGFRLDEVSQKAGIRFVHQAPTLDRKLEHIMPEVASMGASVSVVDFDRDGWDDLYACNSREGSKNQLYRNRGDGTFEELAEQLGIADLNDPATGVSMGAIWGDYDNDGFEDLFLYKWGRPELFRNDGGKKFTRVSETAGLPAWFNANSATWLDYDRDGKLDLFVGGYYREDINLWHLSDTRMMPESFEYARNGGRKLLFHNLGGGRFEEVAQKLGIDSRRWALAVAAADLRGTGYPDIVIANDYGVSEYFLNEGGKRFREVGKETGIGERPKSGMNVAFGDIQNDGNLAIYTTNISEEGTLIQGNNLWLPSAGWSPSKPTYENWASTMKVELGGWSFGAQFGDLNNDGHLDLFLTNGYVSASRDKSYWYDFSKVAGGNSAIISDAANWPPIGDASHSGYQNKRVWLNDPKRGEFIDVAPMVGVTETYDGRAVAMADFWNRGALDVAVAHQKAPLLLYRNTVKPENEWIGFRLEGTKSNRSAIGAQVRVFWNGGQQLQEVSGASGFCAQNSRRLHFGLGPNPKVERVVIRWPSGQEQTLAAPEAGKLHEIKEPA